MRAGGTVVRGAARRRWAVLLAVVAVLCALPVALGVRPVHAPDVDVAVLRQRMTASASAPYRGYAQSTGVLGLPALPGLTEVTTLLTGTTQLRTWYAAADRWRVDVIGPGTERDFYANGAAQVVWDYGRNQLTQIVGRAPVRLPRGADLTPPDLSRRLLAIAAGDPARRLPDRRIAGIAAAGLRITPATAETTVAQVDIWADPRTGLPLQAELTARGGDRPVFVTRFLEVQLGNPPADVLMPPARRRDMGFSVTATPDLLGALNRFGGEALPDRIAGRARRSAVQGSAGVGVYGTGLAQFVVLAVPHRIGARVYEAAVTVGSSVDVPYGLAALIATGLLTVLVVEADRMYLVAGLVDPAVLRQVAVDLAGNRS